MIQILTSGFAIRRKRFFWVLATCAILLLLLLCWFWGVKSRLPLKQGEASNSPSDESQVFSQYAGSESCKSCHEEEFQLWKNSNHGLAERLVQVDRDGPAFDPPRSFQHGTQNSTVRWNNDVAVIHCVGLSGSQETHIAARVIGNDPLRQFLVPFPGGRFQVLEASFYPRSNEWFNVYGAEDRKPGEWGHWTGRGMNWNYMCASCHNTRLRRNYNQKSDNYHTTMAEISVGCEACHGPLKAHNEWQAQFGKPGRKDPTLPHFSRAQVLDYCGFCHARRTELTGDFKPGDQFLDDFHLSIVDQTGVYYADGQVRDEDYEYASFLSSRMHRRGVYCLDCHNPHSMKTILPGNWLCLRCHNGADTNAPAINPVTHSHHKVYGFDTNGRPVNVDLAAYNPREIAQTGGECVNCHMPQTVYMQKHWRHDHGFTIPDPLLTKQFGIPNACNRCHADKDADWSLKFCEEWYGAAMSRQSRQRAQTIARAQRREQNVQNDLVRCLDTEESPYWRAVLLGLLQSWAGKPEVTTALIRGLDETNALVRTVCAAALESALDNSTLPVAEALRRRLDDSVRSVRIAAASSLRATLEPSSSAGQEFAHYLDNNSDEPSGQLQAALFCVSRHQLDSALGHLQRAIVWDPYSAPPREELAVVLSRLNRPREALDTLKEGVRLIPDNADLRFHLGLAYNELGDLKNVAEQLEAAVRLDPRHARAWYNLGLAQNALGQPQAAVESLLRAESVDPEDARSPYARATILARLGEIKDARRAAMRALELEPSSTEVKAFLESLAQ